MVVEHPGNFPGCFLSRMPDFRRAMPGPSFPDSSELLSAWVSFGISAMEGHCEVPQRYKMGDFRLGLWVAVQRRNHGKMPFERQQRLDDIGFVWRVSA